jgi:hypothetical protein
MTPAVLIQQVQAAGGSIHATGGRIKLTAPRPLPSVLVETLKAHKTEVLAYLGDDLAENIREHFEERAAIREHCGGEPREKAEAEARKALRVYEYRLIDYGEQGPWLILLATGGDLAEVERSLRNRFGADRVLAVRERMAP